MCIQFTLCTPHRCEYTFDRTGRVIKFSKEDQDRLVRAVIEPMASEGLRTICVAYRSFSKGPSAATNETQLQAGEEPNWEDEAGVVSGLTCLCKCTMYCTRYARYASLILIHRLMM